MRFRDQAVLCKCLWETVLIALMDTGKPRLKVGVRHHSWDLCSGLYKNRKSSWAVVVHSFNLTVGRQRQVDL